MNVSPQRDAAKREKERQLDGFSKKKRRKRCDTFDHFRNVIDGAGVSE